MKLINRKNLSSDLIFHLNFRINVTSVKMYYQNVSSHNVSSRNHLQKLQHTNHPQKLAQQLQRTLLDQIRSLPPTTTFTNDCKNSKHVNILQFNCNGLRNKTDDLLHFMKKEPDSQYQYSGLHPREGGQRQTKRWWSGISHP